MSFRIKLLGSFGTASALDKDVKDEILLINGAPEPMLLARDRDHNLIKVPFVTKPAGRTSPPTV